VSFSDKATIMIKTVILLVSDVCTETLRSRWQTLASSLAITSHAPSSLPWPMALSLLYHLPHPLLEVPLVEECLHRATTAVHRLQEEVNSLEKEHLANNVFLTASGGEARECLSTLAQAEVVVVVNNVNAVEEGTDLTEQRLEIRYPSSPPPLASNLAHSIRGLLDAGTGRSSSCHSTFYVHFSRRTVIKHLKNIHMYTEPKLASTYRRSKRNLIPSMCP
jgi:hypothetical protein